MTKQQQHDEWHSELKILCSLLIASDKKRKTKTAGKDNSGANDFDVLQHIRNHFTKVSLNQNTEMDSVLGYDDMLDYAKWYMSGKDVFDA